ncbi:MAG TPA: hypothetical protein VFS43_13515 [Polyangiaceae bacterium]|nr:hypothetical protein [Polyangiaceae bacterium]
MKTRSALLAVLSLGAAVVAACSDDSIDFPEYTPPAGTGGSGTGTGGSAPGTGGSTPGAGGSSPGTGGSSPGTGGSGGVASDVDPCVAQNNCPVEAVTADVQAAGGAGEVVWDSTRFRTLERVTYVLPGTTLRVKAGTVVRGVRGAQAGAASALVVQRGARILVEGRADAPVVFTSATAPGNRAPGDWGGLVLCGNARINNPATDPPVLNIEGLPNEARNQCGGPDDADSSGEIHYARIEYAGFKLEDNIELNGLSLYGVGSGTKIDHVQVHLGADDGIEWFGGTVDVKYALVTGAQDDSLDWGYGWRGRLQYGFIIQDDIGPSGNGIEADNINSALADQYGPQDLVASPTLANLTLIGSDKEAADGRSGILFRRTTRGKIYSSLIANFSKGGTGVGVSVEGPNTAVNATDGSLALFDSRLIDNPNDYATNQPAPQINDWLYAPASRNAPLPAGSLPALTEVKLSLLTDLGTLAQAAGSPLLVSPAASAVPEDPFFDPVDFIGACGTSCDEFRGWTAFPQQLSRPPAGRKGARGRRGRAPAAFPPPPPRGGAVIVHDAPPRRAHGNDPAARGPLASRGARRKRGGHDGRRDEALAPHRDTR